MNKESSGRNEHPQADPRRQPAGDQARPTSSPNLTSLRKDPSFLKLWTGQTISVFGTQVSALALPLTAVLVLDARPAQMGQLAASQSAALILGGLLGAAWVDRLSRRSLLVWSDIGRGLLVGSVAAAALGGLLRVEFLYVVAFLAGILSGLFTVAYQTYVPSLVGRERLVEANSKLTISVSSAQLAGPGMAGALVQAVTAPIALLVDACSFLMSALFLRWIRSPEMLPPQSRRRQLLPDFGVGLRFLLRNRMLRFLTGATACFNLFGTIIGTLYILYVIRSLRITPAFLGAILTVGGAGSLTGGLLARKISRWLGPGRAIVGSAALAVVGVSMIPLASGTLAAVVTLLCAASFLRSFGVLIFDVNVMSVRQAITPDDMLGRVNGISRFIVTSLSPLGALLAGVLGEVIGLRLTLVVGVASLVLTAMWLLFSPVAQLRQIPEKASV